MQGASCAQWYWGVIVKADRTRNYMYVHICIHASTHPSIMCVFHLDIHSKTHEFTESVFHSLLSPFYTFCILYIFVMSVFILMFKLSHSR